MRLLILSIPLALLCLSACTWSDLEAEFLAVAPTGHQLSLTPPAGTQAQALSAAGGLGARADALGRERTVYENVNQTAGDVNAMVAALCGGLDAIRTSGLRASEREEDRLTWGPFDDEKRPGLQLRVVMRRGEGSILYGLQWGRKGEPDSFVEVITGEFFGDQASGGNGEFVLDADRARSIGAADPKSPDDLAEVSRVALAYDLREGASQASLTFESKTQAPSAIAYRVEPDGGGWMDYRFLVDLPGTATEAPETLLLQARWLATRNGYAVARVTGGDLAEGTEGFWAECWDESLERTFAERSWACGLAPSCGEGTRESCAPLTLPEFGS
jgi:hypothetical protein